QGHRVETTRARVDARLEGDVHPLQSPPAPWDGPAPHERAHLGGRGVAHRLSAQRVTTDVGTETLHVRGERVIWPDEREEIHHGGTPLNDRRMSVRSGPTSSRPSRSSCARITSTSAATPGRPFISTGAPGPGGWSSSEVTSSTRRSADSSAGWITRATRRCWRAWARSSCSFRRRTRGTMIVGRSADRTSQTALYPPIETTTSAAAM